ncbi:MAG: BRCT domain-containing protein [Clostridium sp.]
MEFFLIDDFKNRILTGLLIKKDEEVIYINIEITQFEKKIKEVGILKIIVRDIDTYKYLSLFLINLNFEFIILENSLKNYYDSKDFKVKDLYYILTLTNILLEENQIQFKKSNLAKINLNGKNILFTGKITGVIRHEAYRVIRNLGGNTIGSFTPNIDILICGKFRNDRFSTKYLKTIALIEKGKEILIIKEEEFLKIYTKRSEFF